MSETPDELVPRIDTTAVFTGCGGCAARAPKLMTESRLTIRHRHRHQTLGQTIRLVLAAPGSLTGRYPLGNTGAADVRAFRPMPIPDDLAPLLPGRATADQR